VDILRDQDFSGVKCPFPSPATPAGRGVLAAPRTGRGPSTPRHTGLVTPIVAENTWPAGRPFRDEAARRSALSGKVAVVTGASRGLGAGLATHFAAAGLHLGLCARHRPEMVARTRPRVEGDRVEAAEAPVVSAVDVADYAALEAFADAVVARFGRIDLWINNAGILEPVGPLLDADPDEVARHVSVNLHGVLFGTMIFARHVAGRGGEGVLCNVTSGAATRPYAGWAAYCATKAAVDQASEVVALEERRHGLRVYAVAPGVVDTDMQSMVRATPANRFPEVDRFRKIAEDGAFNSPAWVAEHLLALAFGEHHGVPVRLRVPDAPADGRGR
jgi:benzil reductase ((S)-benzoin forming)